MDIPSSASMCRIVEVIPGDGSFAALELLSTRARYEKGQTIYRCHEPIEHWYRIVEGAARKSAVTPDGRRHVVDFSLPGEYLGLSASNTRQFCVEATVPGTLVARYPRRRAERLADSDPLIARSIREAAFQSIARLQRSMVILGRTTALEKVSAFLLEMADRTNTALTDAVLLPMSRYDIADYLGIAVETVSRALTELSGRRMIVLRSAREVEICARGALEAFADRPNESGAHRSRDTGRIRSQCGAIFQ